MKDNRNLYLLDEGWIDERHRGDMNERGGDGGSDSPLDVEKRKNDQKEKETKLRNPLFFVNPHRLMVKNLGAFVTGSYLKQICI